MPHPEEEGREGKVGPQLTGLKDNQERLEMNIWYNFSYQPILVYQWRFLLFVFVDDEDDDILDIGHTSVINFNYM